MWYDAVRVIIYFMENFMLRKFVVSLSLISTLMITCRASGQDIRHSALASNMGRPNVQEGVNYRVYVVDSLLGTPIQPARVSLRQDGYVLSYKVTSC